MRAPRGVVEMGLERGRIGRCHTPAMSLWADVLNQTGLTLLTYGTAAQALASRAEYRSVAETDSYKAFMKREEEDQSLVVSDEFRSQFPGYPARDRGDRIVNLVFIVPLFAFANFLWSSSRWPRYARAVHGLGGEDAVRLARLLRQSAVWAVLCLGSALIWLGALIVLIHDA
jgi:hypothetical protein